MRSKAYDGEPQWMIVLVPEVADWLESLSKEDYDQRFDEHLKELEAEK